MMKPIHKWYLEQTDKGRVLVAIATVMLLYFIFIELIYGTWKREFSNLEYEVQEKVETVAFMQAEIQKNRSLLESAKNQSNASKRNGRSFISVIEDSAKKYKIYSSIERISPDKSGRVKVWINNANFEFWLKWVEKLKSSGIDVHSARINQLAPNDKVTLTATFQPAN